MGSRRKPNPPEPKPSRDAAGAASQTPAEAAPPPPTADRGRALRGLRWLTFPLAILACGLVLGGDYWFGGLPAGAKAEFIGRSSCVQCHRPQVEQFDGSNHDRAMETASEASVLGDFADASFKHYGIVSKMYRKDGKYFVSTEGPTGALQEFQVKYTFGVRPLQQYLVELDGGRLQALDVAWDTEKKRWFLLDLENKKQPPGDVLHWTGRGMNWNQMCADCHSTKVERKFDVRNVHFHTSFSEVDVSCEACHGPASLHVQAAGKWSPFWDRVHGKGLVKLKGPDPKPQIETCAPCHARRFEVYPGFQAGQPLLDHFAPELLDRDVYHPDGQIRPEHEGFEYASFLMSKMYRKEVRCTDCHQPHSGKLLAEGNNLCVRCHQAAKFDTPSHHFHKEGTKGASCVECHMPESLYMEVDPRRDHSIRIPRPDVSAKLGTPNACNRCHTKPEETPQWAAKAIADRHPNTVRKPHFGETIALARRSDPKAEAGLVKLAAAASEDEVGPVVRASAVLLLGQRYGTPAATAAIVEALNDAVGMVRFAAAGSGEGRRLTVHQLAPLLSDSLRAVRMRAVQALLEYDDREIPAAYRPAFDRALVEFKTGLEANLDQGGPNFGLGLLALRSRDAAEAEERFRTAVSRDPLHQRAREQLAALVEGRGDAAGAEKILREGVAAAPNEAEMRFSLAKLLAAQPGRAAEAETLLKEATALNPAASRIHYNLALLLQFRNALPEAEAEFAKAIELEPASAEYRHALGLLQLARGNAQGAAETAQRLVSEQPNEAAFRLLWAEALLAGGDAAGAERAALDAQSRAPQSPEVANLLSRVYERLGDRAAALRFAEEAVRYGGGRRPEDIQRLQQLHGGK